MYKFVLDATSKFNGRKRRAIRLVFNPGYTEEEEKEAMLDLVRLAFIDDPDLDAILVFGFSSEEAEKKGPFDRGRAILTRDGMGWDGNNRAFTGPTVVPDVLNQITYQYHNSHWIPEKIAR